MPKTKISEYSATNSSNTDIEGINIDEGCAPSGINNAIRELMVHLKEFQTGASGDAFTFAGGTLMSGTNTISGAAIISGNINSSGTNTFSGSNVMSFSGGSSASPSIYFASDTNTGIFSPAADTIAFTEGGAESMRIDSNGNVGIGTTTPNYGSVDRALGINGTNNSALFFGVNNTLRGYLAAIGNDVTLSASATGYLRFLTDATERMRIDSSGNVGIGTSSPATKLHVFGSGANSRLENSGATNSTQFNVKNTVGTVTLGLDSSTGGGFGVANAAVLWYDAAQPLVFATNNTERARITSGGSLLVGTTTSHSSLTVQGQGSFGSTGSGGNGIYLYINNTLSDNSYLSRASAGSGTTTWYIGNQTITTSSDSRLKANIKPTERNAIELLNQWEIVDHTWNDPSDQCENNRNSRGVWTGVVAQQVQPITPWLVNKPTEEVNEDGTINPWTMDFGYAVPLLVKAIQELKAINDAQATRIETLETKVAVLENK